MATFLFVGAVVPALLLAATEIVVRFADPQNVRTTWLGGEPLGLRDPVLESVNRPGARVREDGPEYSAEYRINSQGFRADRDYPSVPSPGTTRVLLLGDSFAFGHGTDVEGAWPSLLEQRLLNTGVRCEIVNAGVPGYDTTKELLYLERIIDLYSPSLVMLTFLPNDLFTNLPLDSESSTEAQSPGLDSEPPVVVPRDTKRTKLHLLSLLQRLLLSNDRAYVSLYASTARAEFYRSTLVGHAASQLALTQDLLLRIRNSCHRRGVPFTVVAIPQQFEVIALGKGLSPTGISPETLDNTMRDFGRNNGIPWFSLLPALAEAYGNLDQDLYYRIDGHLNERGNRIVAESLVEFMGSLVNSSPFASAGSGPTQDHGVDQEDMPTVGPPQDSDR